MKQRVLLKGSDAIDLLHRISTLDFKRMPLNQNRVGLILNPKGMIVSYFEVTKTSNDSVELSFADQTLEVLDQYTFAENYSITPIQGTSNDAQSEQARIAELTPAFGKEFRSDGTSNPLELNLKSAIDDQKGCYPGQEVIEKIISLGSPAKRLCLVGTKASDQIETPQELIFEGQKVGVLTSFLRLEDGTGIGLALLRKTVAAIDQTVMIGNVALTIERVSE